MNKVIAITGTPCTGKSTIAKGIAKETGFEIIDVNAVIKKHKKELKATYDENDKCYNVDVGILSEFILRLISSKKKNVIVDSHLSHYLPSNKVDLCIVAVCDINVLKKRLASRGYNPNKIKDNLDAEIFEVCKTDASEFGHKIYVVDTTNGIDLDAIALIIKKHLS